MGLVVSVHCSFECLCSGPLKELDRDARVDPEKVENRGAHDDRDSSAFTLEARLELPKGCFLVRRRDSLFCEIESRFDSASASFFKRFSSSLFSLSIRFISFFCFFRSSSLCQEGETQISDLSDPLVSVEIRACCDSVFRVSLSL